MKNPKDKFKIYSLKFLAVILVSYFITSCGPTRNETSQTPSNEVTPVLIEESNNTFDFEAPVSEAVEDIEQTSPQLSEEIKESSIEVKLNPPHGEPGHRCDIAVGAPLDSPPANAAVQTTSSTTQTANTPPTSTTPTSMISLPGGPTLENAARLNSSQPISFTPAKNPPHGQPGHRCDIPVGAPLTTATNSSVTLNPPHGQPGHRCDIPVGEPLPS